MNCIAVLALLCAVGAQRVRLRSVQTPVPQPPDDGSDRPGMWHGQELQDCFAHTLLAQRRGGFFLDLAANDAITFSNTRALERDYGWRGLCIEPNPAYHGGLLARRECTVVAAAVSNESALVEFEFTMLTRGGADLVANKGYGYHSGVFGHITKPDDRRTGRSRGAAAPRTPLWTVPLAQLLEHNAAPRMIDFMSLDVEGHEGVVMSAFPFDTHHVAVLSIENALPKLIAMLLARGYRAVCYVGFDTLFVHEPTMEADGIAPWAIEHLRSTARAAKPTHCPKLMLQRSRECKDASARHKKSNYRNKGIQVR